MESRPTEHRVTFLIFIFFCLVLGACALTIVNYLNSGHIEAAITYQEQRLKAVELEVEKIKKVSPTEERSEKP